MSRSLGIIGVGLIGGSIGLAARNAGWEVIGVDSPDVLEEATSLGAIDRPSTLKEARGADILVLATPISKVRDLLSQLPPTEALVTDAASTKNALVEEAGRQDLRFV
ncbi:MAG: prephenate dehydrogenase/arogenate dehydrogenase family protein, partial [Rubrobacteraceae bacterium]